MRHVLLIDDSPLQLRLREAILRDAGFRVHIATTGEGAMALLRSPRGGESIGAVITDHLMPGMTGTELVRSIRKQRPEMPVIVTTGLPDAFEEYAGLDVIFRQKPVSPAELVALLRDCLGRAAA